MILTRAILHKGKSRKGAYSKIQFETLGEVWPPQKGWYERLLYSEVSEETVERFLALKDAHLLSPEDEK